LFGIDFELHAGELVGRAVVDHVLEGGFQITGVAGAPLRTSGPGTGQHEDPGQPLCHEWCHRLAPS